jgi:ParB family chromosome partitioning protein
LIREFELTHQEAAEAVGRSRAAVSNLLRLMDLGEKVKLMLESREIEMGHARALLALGNATQQLDAARQVAKKKLSVRDTEALVRRMQSERPAGKSSRKQESGNSDIRRLETEITDKIGATVRIDHTSRGSGKMTINYNSLDELDGILKHIK